MKNPFRLAVGFYWGIRVTYHPTRAGAIAALPPGISPDEYEITEPAAPQPMELDDPLTLGPRGGIRRDRT
jgi:hypothetical protein